MSYKLNKTDGDLLVELVDGEIDTVTTDISLIGRNYRGFGEAINENLIHMLENFAGPSAPGAPLTGQLWYDNNERRLKVYDGNTFKSAGGTLISVSEPSLVAGDIWIDNRNKKLYFFDGSESILVGPEFDESQGRSGFDVQSVIDDTSRQRVALKIWIAGNLFGVITRDRFRLSGDNKISEYPNDPNDPLNLSRQLFEPGINLVENSFWYRGTAESAKSLLNSNNQIKSTDDFLPNNEDGTTTGTLTIRNSGGLKINVGGTSFADFKVRGSTTVLETQQPGNDFALTTRFQNQFLNSVLIKSQDQRVGIYNNNPSYTLDVNGTFRVTGDAFVDGNLLVGGDTTSINVNNLTVEDKNIELGLLDNNTKGDDQTIDNAGVIVPSTQGNKNLVWINNTKSWTSDQDFNLINGSVYKVDNQKVLTKSELGPTVTTANGLTSIGTLNDLNVDNINVNDNQISTINNSDLVINANNTVNFSFTRLTDVTDPQGPQEVATKNYVDLFSSSSGPIIPLVIDTTGLNDPDSGNPYNDVRNILETLQPSNIMSNGQESKIHCVNYNVGSSVSDINVDNEVNKSFVEVESTSGNNESVLQDFSVDPVNGTIAFSPRRQTMTFKVENSVWVWKDTV